MADSTHKIIIEMLLSGKKRQEIYKRLQENEDNSRLAFLLNNEAELADRKKHQLLTLGTALLLLWLTAIKVLDAMALGRFDLYWLASLVVPIIHIYVLRKILRFQRTGFQFMFVLGLLGLFRPENHQVPELPLLITLIGLSGFLFFFMFPKEKMIKTKQ